MKAIIIKEKTPENYYKQRMVAHLAGGWEVKKETKWYTDIVKNDSSYVVHFLLLFCAPIIGNYIYDKMSSKTKRILKSIRQ